MAMVLCPECKKEISNKAASCPHCGYVLEKIEVSEFNRTPLGEIKKNPAAGIGFIIMGIVAIGVGIPLLAVFVGVFSIFGGFAFIGLEQSKISGTRDGHCPYCDHEIVFINKSTTFKCPHCKKRSTYKEDGIETIQS